MVVWAIELPSRTVGPQGQPMLLWCNGAGLRALREKDGLSRVELGQKVDVSHSTIYDIEHGKRNPSYELAVDLAEALEVPLDAFCRTQSPRPAREEPRPVVEPSSN